MGTKEQYEHSQSIAKRTIQQKLAPQQYTFSNVETKNPQSIAVDDFCRKCGDVTVHELFARSVSENANTKCTECDTVAVAQQIIMMAKCPMGHTENLSHTEVMDRLESNDFDCKHGNCPKKITYPIDERLWDKIKQRRLTKQ